MRKNRVAPKQTEISILALDDDRMMTLTLQSYFQSSGYHIDVENDPNKAVERIRENNYDILLLDFLMSPICGDEVVKAIREFNTDLYIILLTGHKSLAPPIKTIRELDIQGYYEKSDRFDQLELLVESCVKSIRQMRTIRGYRDKLSRIVEESPQIYQLTTIDALLEGIMNQMNRIFGVENAFLYVQPHFFKGEAVDTAAIQMPEDYYLGIGAYHESEDQVRRYFEEKSPLRQYPVFEESEDEPCRVFGLMDENQKPFGIFGVRILHRNYFDTVRLLEIYLRQVTSTISNLMLHVQLQKAYGMLQNSYEEMTVTVRTMVDARDLYTRGHSDRVSYYAGLIAEKMGKDEKFLNRIRVAGLFHDIGKIAVPDSVLLKSTSLTEEEFAVIKRHPAYGYQILSAISSYQEIAPIVLCHHERIDGKGYPKGITGEQIPEESKMISVADAFDAMTSHRRYRENLTLEQALDQLEQGKEKQFDAKIVDVFMDILREYEDIRKKIAWTYEETALGHEQR